MLTDLQYLCRTTFYETFSDSTDEEDMRKFLAETYSAEKLSAELANSESVTFIAYKKRYSSRISKTEYRQCARP